MLTYHNKPDLKCALIYRAERHAHFDRLRPNFGYFAKDRGKKSYGEWKGCAIGCLAMPAPDVITEEVVAATFGAGAFNESRLSGAGAIYEECSEVLGRDFGLPDSLVEAAEEVFEALELPEAKLWPAQFARAVPIGVEVNDTVLSRLACDAEPEGLVEYLTSLAPNQEQPVCTAEAERIAITV